MRDRLPRVTIAGRAPPGAAVLTGTTRPELVVDENGDAWVFKPTTSIRREGVFSEILVGLLGMELEVAVPEMAIPQKWPSGWLSKYHPSAHWDPMVQGAIDNLASLGASLVLDAIVGNADRHAKNIILSLTGRYEGDVAQLHAWCIDHENCWLSDEQVLVALSENNNLEKPLM